MNETANLMFFVENERPGDRGSLISAVEVRLPADARLVRIQAKPGWTTASAGRTIAWRGGRIGSDEFDTFTARVTLPVRPGKARFDVALRYGRPSGRVDRFPAFVTVEARPFGAAAASGDETGKTALYVAVAACAIALGAFFVALTVWLKGSSRLSES